MKPSSGDFAELVKNDLESIGLAFNPNQIRNTDTQEFKKFIKEKISLAAFKYLTGIQSTHSKVRDIEYNRLETQSYLLHTLFNNHEIKLLSSIRLRTNDPFKKKLQSNVWRYC